MGWRDVLRGLPVGGHLGEAHFKEDIAELVADFVHCFEPRRISLMISA